MAITVLGAGAWGTALAVHLARRPGTGPVRLWAARPESYAALAEHRENRRLLPGVEFPASLQLTADFDTAVDSARMVFVAIPTVVLRPALAPFAGRLPPSAAAISMTKGIEAHTFERPSEIIAATLGPRPLAVLSGPSHAAEVARGMPTSLVVASTEAHLAATVQDELGTERVRLYTNSDVVGVEIAGALKNVLGIAAGICDGLGFGDNAKAALLTRGIVEMTRFGVAHGADPATFSGLAGVGDLITTCFSPHGRNRRVGERLARGEPLAAALAGPHLAEGVNTCRAVAERCRLMGLDAPIMSAVDAVVHQGVSPLRAVQALMTREPKGEVGGPC